MEVQAEKTGSGFPKIFWEHVSMYLLNISTTTLPKWEQNTLKIMF